MDGPIRNDLFQSVQATLGGFNLESVVDAVVQGTAQAVQQSLDQIESLQTGLMASPGGVAAFADFPEVDMAAEFYRAVGDVVQDVSVAVDKAIEDAFADYHNDGQIETISPAGDGEAVTDSKVYVVNGIRQPEDSRVRMAENAADLMGKDVELVHNSSGGFILDAVEYFAEVVFGIPSPATQSLSDEIYNNMTANPPQDTEIIAYSQGSAQTAHALALAIDRMKQDGMTDDEIRDRLKHCNVKMIGTPVDPNNPMQTMMNVPPGPLGALSGNRLDDYFVTEDRVLHGGDPPSSETIQKETGETNWMMIRHEKDPIATSLHDTGPLDVAALGSLFTPLSPAGWSHIGARVVSVAIQLGVNQLETDNIAGYHEYHDIYFDYMDTNVYGNSDS